MVGNYKGEITSDGKFTCYISRKVLDYVENCGLDFKVTFFRERLLFSNDELKKAGMKAGQANLADGKFFCFINNITYLEIDLALEFDASENNNHFFISRDACLIGAEECGKNREELM